MKDIAIFGAGGFGREVLTIINAINSERPTYNIIGYFDDGASKGALINGYPVLGGIDEVTKYNKDLDIVIAIGNPKTKERIVEKLKNKNISFPIIIHPQAIICDNNYVSIGKGSIVCAGCIVTTNIEIGNFTTLNLGCTVGHDTIIGDYVSIMPSVNISGEVNIDKGTYIGTGAKVINKISIGNYTIIGAGSVVINDIPDNVTVVGVPAKIIDKK